jgi:hypothetical protein
MKDQRDVCDCHRECSVEPHACAAPCRWPDCLTEADVQEVLAEMRAKGEET